MGADDSKELVRRWFEEGFFGDLSLADELFAPVFIRITDGLKRTEEKLTISDYKDGVQRVRRAFPDGRFTVSRIVAERGTVTAALTLSGTHTEKWGDQPPTHKKRRMTSHMFLRFAEGKLVEMAQYPFPSGQDI